MRREVAEPVPDVIRKGKRVLRLSNLDKPFWPDEGITKGDLLALLPRRRAGARPAPARPAVHDAPLPRRRVRQGVLPEGRAVGHAGLDPDGRASRSRRATGRGERRRIDVAARERRARAALDGEHGLHRPEHLVLAGRQARPARLRALRPRPDARRRLPRDGAGRAAREGGARRARARVVPEDERRRRDPRARPDRAAAHLRGHARSSRRSSPARWPRRTADSSRPSGRSRSARAS